MSLATESRPLEFNADRGELSQKFMAPTAKIGWLHTFADTPGVRFDIVVKDGLGREKFRKANCGNDTVKYGELINLPTLVGENLQVELSNVKGAKNIKVFLN